MPELRPDKPLRLAELVSVGGRWWLTKVGLALAVLVHLAILILLFMDPIAAREDCARVSGAVESIHWTDGWPRRIMLTLTKDDGSQHSMRLHGSYEENLEGVSPGERLEVLRSDAGLTHEVVEIRSPKATLYAYEDHLQSHNRWRWLLTGLLSIGLVSYASRLASRSEKPEE